MAALRAADASLVEARFDELIAYDGAWDRLADDLSCAGWEFDPVAMREAVVRRPPTWPLGFEPPLQVHRDARGRVVETWTVTRAAITYDARRPGVGNNP